MAELDYSKDGIDNILDLLNDANSSSYTKAHLAFGTPQPNLDPPPGGEPECNTKITAVGKPTVDLTGEVLIRYNRVGLSEVLNTVDFELDNSLGEYFTVNDLRPWFLDRGYLFDDSDLENDLIVALAPNFEQTIRAKPESVRFTGVAKIKITDGT